MTTATAVADALRAACAEVREATEADAVDGMLPALVAEAGSTEEVSAVLAEPAAHHLVVVPRGAGTRIGWGAPPRAVDLVMDVSRMNAVLEHAAGDLIATVQAGARLVDVQAALDELLGPTGQPGATVGGTIATATAGPLRYGYGSVRDLLIGISVVRADGTVTRSGGKVVKNVAGYDLGKLYTGSIGTLGVITEAVFRLHPRPEAARWIVVQAPDARRAGVGVAAVRASQVMPCGLEVDRPAGVVAVTVGLAVEGITAGIDARADTVAGLLAEATGARPEQAEQPPEWWGRLPFDPASGVGIGVTCDPAALPELLDGVPEGVALRGSAGVGVLAAALPTDTGPDAVADALQTLRTVARRHGGSAVLPAPPAVKAAVDVWGPTPTGVLGLMRRIKDEFDPEHRLSPGRFVGGI